VPAPVVLAFVAAALVSATCLSPIMKAFLKAIEPGTWVLFPPFWDMHTAAVLSHAKNFAIVLFLTFIFSGSGILLLRLISLSFENSWEKWAFAYGLGAGAWAYIFFLLGMAGMLYKPLLLALLALGAVASAYAFSRAKLTTEAERGNRIDSVFWVSSALLIAALLMTLPYAAIPETFYDSLLYHLELPKLYLFHHHILPFPDNVFAGIPSTPQMIFGWGLALDDWGVASHLMHYSFLPWIACAMMGLATRLGKPRAGVLSAFLLCLIPSVSTESYRTSVGLEWGFFQLLAMHSFLAAAEVSPDDKPRKDWLLLSAIFLGLAMSTQYLAWLLPIAFLAVYLRMRRRVDATWWRFRELVFVFASAALVLSPWLFKNLWFYGNPIFPFFNGFFARSTTDATPINYLRAGGNGLSFTNLSWESLKAYLLHPFGMVLNETGLLNSLGPVFLGLLPLLACVRPSRGLRPILWFAAWTWLPLSLATFVPRYFTPALIPLSLCFAMALLSVPSLWLRTSLESLAIAASLLTGIACWGESLWHPGWQEMRDVFLGSKSYSDFLGHANRTYYSAPPFAGYEYLDRELGPQEKVLVVGDGRGFYLQHGHFTSIPGQELFFDHWVRESASPQALRELFRKNNVTHILVNVGFMMNQHETPQLSGTQTELLADFWSRYALKVWQIGPSGLAPMADDPEPRRGDRWVVVYRILSETEASRPHPIDSLFVPKSSPR
jgi:hypothetical protein